MLIKLRIVSLSFLLFFFVSNYYLSSCYANSGSSLEAASDDAYQDTVPHIPEPMIFDLVRPLGAKKGELEINTLIEGKYNDGSKNHIFWSPEVEYALRDGLAVEIELPIKDAEIEALKLAVQKTLGTAFKNKFIHGVQLLYRHERFDEGFLGDGLYIFGYRFNDKWSTLSMKGLRRADLKHESAFRGILNNSIFYDLSGKIILGLETNFRYGRNNGNFVQLMPQVHLRLSQKLNLQLGFGFERASRDKIHPSSAIRIIKEF